MRKLLACLMLLGCGGSADIDDTTKAHAQSIITTDWPTLGRWHKLSIDAIEEWRAKGDDNDADWSPTHTKIAGLVEVVSQGEKPVLRFQPCRVILPVVADTQPTLPDSTIQAAAPVTVQALWTQDANGFNLSTPDWSAMIMGAQLTDAVNEALPTNKNDARVRDMDNDGKPGVSMKASIAKLYMVMRGKLKLAGSYDANTGITGTADYAYDFYVFGDNVFGQGKDRIDTAYAENDRRPGETHGSLTPISAAAPTCSDVLLTE